MPSLNSKKHRLLMPSKGSNVVLSLLAAISLAESGCGKKDSDRTTSSFNSSLPINKLPSLPQGALQLYVANGKGFETPIESNLNYAASYLTHLWSKTGDSRAKVLSDITLIPIDNINSLTGTTETSVASWTQGIGDRAGVMRVNIKKRVYLNPFKVMVTFGHECSHATSKISQTSLRLHCIEERNAYAAARNDARLIKSDIQSRRDIPNSTKNAIAIVLTAQELEQEVLGIQYNIRALLCSISEGVADRNESARILTLAKDTVFNEQELLQIREVFRVYGDMRRAPHDASTETYYTEGNSALDFYRERYRALAVAQDIADGVK